MKTFYSIVYCAIRPNVDEKVSIGLLMVDGSKSYFQYSTEKLAILKQMISSDAYNLIKTALKSISKVSSECGTDVFPNSAYKGKSAITESYIAYLSNYSNNLISYSVPIEVNVELNDTVYRKLFQKFIFYFPVAEPERVKPMEVAKKRLSKSISKHVAFDVELDKSKVPGLIVPAKVWFIGKNEVQVTGEAKDFSGAVHTLQQQLNAHLFLIEKIKDTPDGKHGKFFMIGDEPDRRLSENHSLWNSIKDANIVDLVPTGEIERVEEYMEVHGVEPA